MKTEILHSPDNGSTAAVLLNGPLGRLYVQILDSYGFQREMTLREMPEDAGERHFGPWTVNVYQHPGRRDIAYLSDAQAERLVARIREVCADHPSVLFNVADASVNRARCHGFVHLCEAIHNGQAVGGKLGWLASI